MRPFEYARPETEAEAVEFLNEHDAQTAVLAGGTDLLNLLKADLVSVKRVVDIKHVPSLREVKQEEGGVTIGAAVTLEEMAEHPLLAEYQSLHDVIDGVRAIQIQSSGTLGGDLCHHPNCWYYRNGYGLLALDQGKSLVTTGDNRYHAILDNFTPAKFVSASRFAPGLMAYDAKVRIVRPKPVDPVWVPLSYFFSIPRTNQQGTTVLKPGEFVSHVWLPRPDGFQSATYEVVQLEGLDWPLAAAAACLYVKGGIVRQARLVLGHVGPVPYVAGDAARWLVGKPIDEENAAKAAEMAVASATPLSQNDYKVQLARTATKRAILKAAGHTFESLSTTVELAEGA